MEKSLKTHMRIGSLPARAAGVVALLLVSALLFSASASASFEQVGTFGAGSSGLAVNTTGAGGVPAGTVYSVQESSSAHELTRYSAKGELLGESGEAGGGLGVAVDQATGNVYVLTTETYSSIEPNPNRIHVYSPDASELIASFGEQAGFSETVGESPAKIHGGARSGLAVDSSGVVYVSDIFYHGINFESRVMVFDPESPGDYEHYVYSGRANDIAAGEVGGPVNYTPLAIALDNGGHLYIANEGAIYKFASDEPHIAACTYKVPGGGVRGMTVDPKSGEVFYYSYKTDTKIHQLGACNAQGEFVETDRLNLTPSEKIDALTLNPIQAYESSRPPGILYAGSRIFAPTEARSPIVESESVSSVSSSTARLGAQINPQGSVTRYAFQYITEAAYNDNEPAERFAGAMEAPLGGAMLGSGNSTLPAAASLTGLAPDTTYRYRVVATSACEAGNEEEVCGATGSPQAFHTFPVEAPGLPDGRVWELVSPAQKNGGEVFPAEPTTGSCLIGCKPNADGGLLFPMQSAPDGNSVLYQGFPFSATEGARIGNQYISRRTESGWQTTILSPLLQTEGYSYFNAKLTHGILGQRSPTLTPQAPSGYPNLYAQPSAAPGALTPLLGSQSPNRSAGELQLSFVGASADFSQLFFEANDALTGATPFAPEAVDGGASKNNLYEFAGGQLHLVNVAPANAGTAAGGSYGSAAPDALHLANYSHVISNDGSRVFWSNEAGQVFVRENGETTREIPDPGRFLSAAADGSKVLLNDGHLYDLETGVLTDLTGTAGDFQGIVGQSEDLSHVYFVDTAVLTGAEENDQHATAQPGKNNLYLWHENASTFVATLLADEDKDWEAAPPRRTAEASPGGRWVAFLSKAPLTGYENIGPCVLQDFSRHIGPCLEVFLYDSVSGQLSCASCDPSGTRPLGKSTLRLIGAAQASFAQPRYLTDSGRLYFDTQDSLSPFDTNEGVEDVYQYEPSGTGSCARQAGCVSLISAGHEPVDSNFVAADASGKNVFFDTRDQLVLKDRDDLLDLYDAREGGGISSETEAARAECQGEACQGAIAPPNDPTPASLSFEGLGNVNEKKTAKSKHKHHKHKQKHSKKKHRKQSDRRTVKHNRGGVK